MVRAEMPADVADAFDGLPARPAIRLAVAQPGDPVVGQLGGDAALPADHPWPAGPGGRPLTFVARLDLAALSVYEVDLDLPDDGALLFFLPSLEEMSGEDEPAPVVHVPRGTATVDRRAPGADVYPLVPLTARTILTVPGPHQPAISAELTERLYWREHNGQTLGDIVRRYRGYTPDHQVGGYSDAFQCPLEFSAAFSVSPPAPGSDPFQDPAVRAEAEQWLPLFQLDEESEAQMIWGDGAIAMWAIRREDLARRDFTATYFTVDGH